MSKSRQNKWQEGIPRINLLINPKTHPDLYDWLSEHYADRGKVKGRHVLLALEKLKRTENKRSIMKPKKWQYDVSAFCARGRIEPDSATGKALHALSDREFAELTETCDPAEDALLRVDSDGFTLNHGNIGSYGIRYDFRR